MTEFPVYNQVVELPEGWLVEIQANSGATVRARFSDRGPAERFARRTASRMLTREHWEPHILTQERAQ